MKAIFEHLYTQVSGVLQRLRLPGKTAEESGAKKTSGKASSAPTKRETIIAVIAGCAILAGVVAGGVFLYSNIKSDGSKPSAHKQAARGYTLTPPTGWTQVKPTPEGASVAFTAPSTDTDATGKLPAFVVVQSAALNKQAQQAIFESIAKTYAAQLAQGYTDFQSVSTTFKTIAGMPALLMIFTSTSDKTAVTTESLFTVKDGISYTVNGGALTSTWPQHSAEIEQSLLTFRP